MNRKTISPQVLSSAGVRWREGNHPRSSTAHRLDSKGYQARQATPLSSGAACELFKPGGHHPLEVNIANENPLAKPTLMGNQEKGAESEVPHNLLYRISTRVAQTSCGNSLHTQNSLFQF